MCNLCLDQHWLQWGGQNKAKPFRFTMGTLSARTGEGRGNKQNTRVTQTTCHKAFSRTGLTGTPGSRPAPGVRQGSSLWWRVGEEWQAVGERETEREMKRNLCLDTVHLTCDVCCVMLMWGVVSLSKYLNSVYLRDPGWRKKKRHIYTHMTKYKRHIYVYIYMPGCFID